MRPTVFDLCHGMKLFHIKTDRFKCELLNISLLFPSNGARNSARSMALALPQYGTVTYPERRLLCRHFDEMYSLGLSFRNRPVGDMQILSVNAEFLGERYVGTRGGLLSETVTLLAELLRAPRLEGGVFPEVSVEIERKNRLDAIRMARKDPRFTAHRNCVAALCRGEDCINDLDETERFLQCVTSEELTAEFGTLLKTAVPTFFFVGSTDGKEVATHLCAAFGDIAATGEAYRALLKKPSGAPLMHTEQMPVSQSQLVLGFRGEITLAHKKGAALVFLNEIFGATPASKLFLRVREEKGLCYHCASGADAYKGLIFATAGISRGKRDEAESSMAFQFDEMKKGNISQVEMEAARRSLDHSYRQILDSPASLADFYLRRIYTGISTSPEDCRAAFARVTRSDVEEVANAMELGAVSFVEGTKNEEENDDD